MIAFPPCKINLGLQILNKRPDGYHNIATCFLQVPWTDILEIIPSDELKFTSSGNSIPGNERDNLCLKAYNLLKIDFDLKPVKIHLHKVIPTGAGLGGGSSDAAFTLKLLNEIFSLKLSLEKLTTYAALLGSDCAFFIYDRPMLGIGRGEILLNISIDLKGKYLIIVKPNIHVSTADAYAGVKPHTGFISLAQIFQKFDVYEWKDNLKNYFEDSVFKMNPLLNEIKKSLYNEGAIYASMSGSGSSVYGIFEKPVQLKDELKKYKTWTGIL